MMSLRFLCGSVMTLTSVLSRFSGPSPHKSDTGDERLIGCGLVFETLKQCVEISHGRPRKTVLLHPGMQTAEQIVHPANKLRTPSNRHFDSHVWRRHPSLLEGPVQDRLHIHVGPGALESLVDERSASCSQREVRTQLKKRTPARILNGQDPTWAKQLRERAYDCAGIGHELQNEAANDRIEGNAAGDLTYVRYRESHIA